MQTLVRSLAVGGAAAACAATLVLPTSTPTPNELLAQALYMRGTKIGNDANLSDQGYADMANGFITNSACADGGDCILITSAVNDKVDYPAEFWPLSQGGIDAPTYGESVQTGLTNLNAEAEEGDLIFGYSQSAVVISLYMREHPDEANTYVLLSNPMRPNGGILQRFAFIGTIPILDIPLSGATPTEGEFTAFDIARQYDGWADFPTNPLNALATVNAILGIYYLHGQYTQVDPTDLQDPSTDVDQYNDTTYYTLDTPILPLLLPLQQAGVPNAVLAGFDAPLRVLVEAGYDRGTSPGEATGINIFSGPDPITLAANFFAAIPVGIDDGLEQSNGIRPLGTQQAGIYGVGGEDEQSSPFQAPLVQSASVESTSVQRTVVDNDPVETLAADEDDSEPATEEANEDTDENESGAHALNRARFPDRIPATDLLGDAPRGDSASAPRHLADRPLSRFVNRILGNDNSQDDDSNDSSQPSESNDSTSNDGAGADS